MNLFLVGGDAGRAADVLESLRSPFLQDGELARLPAGACLSHPPDRVGGVRHADPEGLFYAGRPIVWAGDEADGRGPLDPAAYRDGTPSGLDGRFAVGRHGPEGWEVVTDPLGAYPVYRCGPWLSNWPEALRRVRGSEAGLDLDAVAGVIGGGWSLDGHPLWAGIERLPWSGSRMAPGGALEPRRAAALLVAGLRALADWPGRPNVVLVTGGRDSRLILAAALRAGFAFAARTGGTEDAPDVVGARALCRAAGVEHGLLDPHPHGDFCGHWRAMARTLAATTGGTATLADASGFPLGPNPRPPAPLPLWHTGQGGEIARAYYGSPDTAGLVARFLTRRPGRPSLLSDAGEARVRAQIEAWVAGLGAPGAGGPPEAELGDLFYLHRRMATWAAPSHAAVEPVRDSTSALWSHRLLPHLTRGEFHDRVLAELAPELVEVAYADRPRSLPRKALAELRRRTVGRVLHASRARRSPASAFPGAMADIAECVRSQPAHPAWEVLDRARVEALLDTPPAALDEMRRAYVLRLGTVFGGFPAGPATQ